MKQPTFIQVLKKDKFLILILILSVFSLLRGLYMPLIADETSYLNISQNILEGKYFLKEYPTTFPPVIPFLLALFSTPFYQTLGIILLKSFFMLLTALGFRFLYLFLKEQQINQSVSIAIVFLTLTNPTSISWFSRLYPEAILFFSFWGFIYYFSKELSMQNLKKILLFFLLLSITRYVYGILGLLLVFYYYRNLSANKLSFGYMLGYSILFATPFLLWLKYVYHIESNHLSNIGYFTRFQHENPFLHNIKCGLGLVKGDEVNKINGIPAFISLYVPITGLRNYVGSLVLIIAFLIGYFRVKKTLGVKVLLTAVISVMLGLIVAGTGFSRYWLVVLPGFYLGYYFLFKSFNCSDKWFIIGAKIIMTIYIINELRLDYLIFNKY